MQTDTFHTSCVLKTGTAGMSGKKLNDDYLAGVVEYFPKSICNVIGSLHRQELYL